MDNRGNTDILSPGFYVVNTCGTHTLPGGYFFTKRKVCIVFFKILRK